MDPTIIVALVTAIAAIIAPIVTSVVNAVKEYKLKKLELKYTKRINAFIEFADSMSKLSDHPDSNRQFYASAAKAAMFVKDKETQRRLLYLAIISTVDKPNLQNVETEYNRCIKLIVEEIR